MQFDKHLEQIHCFVSAKNYRINVQESDGVEDANKWWVVLMYIQLHTYNNVCNIMHHSGTEGK